MDKDGKIWYISSLKKTKTTQVFISVQVHLSILPDSALFVLLSPKS